MQIVFYSHQSRLGSGGTESLLGIVRYLSKKHDCFVVTPTKGALNIELSNLGISNIIIPFKWSSGGRKNIKGIRGLIELLKKWISNWLFNKRQLNQHLEFLKKTNPDIIYSNTSVINIGVILAKKLKIKHVWHLREFQSFELAPDFGFHYLSYYLKESSIIIVNSNTLKSYYTQFVNSQKIRLVYNGLETTKNKSIDYSIKKNNKFYTFLMIGTLSDRKSHFEGIVALTRLIENNYKVQLYIVGEGRLRGKIEEYIKKNSLEESVILFGQQQNVESFYKEADCYLMCSKCETFGRVTVEAMLNGLPIIGKNSQYNAAKELMRNGVDGWLYSDDLELVEKMKWMFNNKNKSIEMGKSGHKWALENFSLKRSVRKIEELLTSMS
jgi:glycosyltransferase involved in cell wall biosynthesis